MDAQKTLDKMYGQPTEVLPEDRLEKVLRRILLTMEVAESNVPGRVGHIPGFSESLFDNIRFDMQMYVDITKEIDNDDD